MKYIFLKLMLRAEEDIEAAKHFSGIETIDETIKTCESEALSAAH